MTNLPADTSAFIGRMTHGKTIGPEAPVGVVAHLLARAVGEIERRETTPETEPETRIVYVLDEAALYLRHPDRDDLRALIATVNRRGPVVDVHICPPEHPQTGAEDA
ncbi:hypothetical protein [Streptomyces sp. NPDC051546]|uniref:hypothetical protein n=1 Tax=Streptomyces sp. NPDC051546 TaxID=3365655 RepID=UPI0037A77D47